MKRPSQHAFILAGALIVLAIAIFSTRYIILDGNISGLFSGPKWNISFNISAETKDNKAYVKLFAPSLSDAQHITSEDYKFENVTLHFLTEGVEKNRVLEWRNSGRKGAKNIQLLFSAQIDNSKPYSRPIKKEKQEELIPYYLKNTEKIQAASPVIYKKAEELTSGFSDENEKIKKIYDFCAYEIGNKFVLGTDDALTCLENKSSDCGGKSRLMVALCRAVGVSARLAGGLLLDEGIKNKTHVWVEVWQNNSWVPYCPLNRHAETLPQTYLLLYRGDYALMRHKYIDNLSYFFNISKSPIYLSHTNNVSTNLIHSIANSMSLSQLPPGKQWIIHIFLLLPVGALVVCVFRNIIGIPAIGTFGPALIALGIYMVPLKWGIITLLIFLSLGLSVRWIMDKLKLLLVPRLSVMLTVVIIGMIILVLMTNNVETELGAYVGLLPVVILTMLIERCWMLELEDGFLTMFKNLMGTLVTVTVIYFVFRWKPLSQALFVIPELLLIIIALMLMVGCYSWFRVSEFFRFYSLKNSNIKT